MMREFSLGNWLSLSLVAFALHVLLTQIVVMSGRITTSYRAVELGASEIWIGIIAASFSLLPLLIATATGRWIDRRGARGVMLVGCTSMCAAGVCFVFLGMTMWGLMLASTLLGLGHLLCMLAQHAQMAGTKGTEGLDRRFGHYTALISVGQVAGPVVVAFFGGGRNIPDTSALFVLMAFLSAVVLLCGFLIRAEAPSPRTLDEPDLPMISLLRLPGVFPAVLAGVGIICAIDLLVIYLPVLGASAGIPAAAIAGLLTLRALVSLGSRILFQWFFRIFGRRVLLTGSVLLCGVGLGVLGLPISYPGFSVSVILVGLGVGFAIPLSMSWISSIVPPHTRGLALSLRLTGNRLAQLVLPATVGLLASVSSLGVAFLLFGGALLVIARRTDRALKEEKVGS